MPADQATADLYEHDIVVWADRQADLLRRLAAGERVNAEIDWDNLIEEIETVGRSERVSVQSLLRRAIEHLLKIHGWPDGPVGHWKAETSAFLVDARERWTPSMASRIDLAETYVVARTRVIAATTYGAPRQMLPAACPLAFGDLIVPSPAIPDIEALLAKLAAG